MVKLAKQIYTVPSLTTDGGAACADSHTLAQDFENCHSFSREMWDRSVYASPLQEQTLAPVVVATMVETDAPRCSTCQHTPLTLFVSAASQIVRARMGCVCRSMVLYDGAEQRTCSAEVQSPCNGPALKASTNAAVFIASTQNSSSWRLVSPVETQNCNRGRNRRTRLPCVP